MFLEIFMSVIFVPGENPRACEKLDCVNPPSVALQKESSIVPRPSLGSSSPIVFFGSVAVITKLLSKEGRRTELPPAALGERWPAQAASMVAPAANKRAAIRFDITPPKRLA